MASTAQWEEVAEVQGFDTWLSTALRELYSLSALGPDWDSYGSQPISRSAIAAAERLLTSLEVFGDPAPSIVPVSGGGIQIEWHTTHRDLEFEILPNGVVHCFEAAGDQTSSSSVHSIDDARRLACWILGH
jgi:hypothetical protein